MTGRDYRGHISSEFNSELEAIRLQVLTMGGLVEQQVASATRALTEGDSHLGEWVSSKDKAVNRLELAIDDECCSILARRQPAAGDLRLVYAIIKASTDLERIGDEAARIARMAVELASMDRGGAPLVELGHLSRAVSHMLRDALDAFARVDAEAALAAATQDEAVDREYDALMRQCVTLMMEEPRHITQVMDVIWSLRALERIGDHARNIAEYVIYLVKGKDVRHISLEQVQQELAAERRRA